MYANQLKKGESGTISAIHADKILRDRFTSFGIVPGEEIIIKQHSLTKQTIELSIAGALIILRTSEAKKIEISKKEEEK